MKIENYLENRAADESMRNEANSNSRNSNPCDVCGSVEFVQLYRNVVGEVEGRMTGNFSLFGGSVSGHISGYTKTLPVFSCRKCNNERLIDTWNYTSARDLFWSDMHNFYFGLDSGKRREIDSVYLENPVETRNYMIDNRNYEYDFYNELPGYSTQLWAWAGFKILPIEKKFLFFRWKRYPYWEEL